MKYLPHIILYFDVLGYSEMVAKGNNEFIQSRFKLLKNVTKRIHEHIKPHTQKIVGFKVHTYNYTDNFCIAFEAENDNAANNCTALAIFYAAQLQSYLAHGGIFIRGCIIKENIVAAKNFLQGKGTLVTHFYEDKIAIYPRIIIQKTLVSNLLNMERNLTFGKLDTEYTEIFADMVEFCLCDGDGYYMIDYLKYSHYIDKDDSVIEYHKKYILLFLYNAVPKSKIFDKYLWALLYHNLCCEMLNLEHYAIDMQRIYNDFDINDGYILESRKLSEGGIV